MHVVELLDELRLTSDVKIVKARLPELRQTIVSFAEWEPELYRRRGLARLAPQAARHSLFQDLHNARRIALGRLTDEQVDVIGHHDVTHKRESVAVTHLSRNFHKQILRARGGKQGQTPVTTACDEVKMAQSVPATQSFRHNEPNQKPRP